MNPSSVRHSHSSNNLSQKCDIEPIPHPLSPIPQLLTTNHCVHSSAAASENYVSTPPRQRHSRNLALRRLANPLSRVLPPHLRFRGHRSRSAGDQRRHAPL